MEAAALSAFKTRFLDILFPPQCLKCASLVAETGTLCATCWLKISFIDGACCEACGLPFEYDLGPAALCGACSQDRPLFSRARSAMIYNAASRDIILAFKHGDKTHAVAAYGKWLFRAGSKMSPEIDVIVPVPLHWSRLFHRRYNQAALLAIEFSKLSGIPARTNILRRHKKTASQGHKTVRARHTNLRGAFSVPSRAKAGIKDKKILLIDDVFTTGATAQACTKILLQAGVKNVDVLTLARVVRTEIATPAQSDDDALT